MTVDHEGCSANALPEDLFLQVRRFKEVWTCDRRFREALLDDAESATRERGFTIDPRDLRVFWDENYRDGIVDEPTETALRKITPAGLIWIELGQRLAERYAKAREECMPADPRFAAWRQRQIARCDVSLGPEAAASIVHSPFAIELSKGCSVGCWFCGLSAGGLDRNHPYDGGNADGFRAMLKVFAEIAGVPACRHGILYWATDPFDHPHYERFCRDFAREFGVFPDTTTARGWKDPDRVHQLIEEARKHGKSRLRLSVLGVRILDRYFAELSRSELRDVEFVAVNKGSYVPLANVGRARARSLIELSSQPPSTIASTSGFLVNLVDHSVKLISPCPSSDQWPDGYIVFDERRYSDPDSFRAAVGALIASNMTTP